MQEPKHNTTESEASSSRRGACVPGRDIAPDLTGDGEARGTNFELSGRGRSAAGERGIAVVLVVACLAILAPFVLTFNYDAKIEFQSGVNAANEVKARNLQRGAMRLSVLLFELQKRVFNKQEFRDMLGAMDITQVAPYLMSMFGSSDGAEGVSGLIGIDPKVLGDLAIEEGNFEVRMEAESGKLNVNCLASTDENTRTRVVMALEAMMAPKLYDPMFEEEKSDGQRYTRQDVIAAIVDYVDDDVRRYDAVRMATGSAVEGYRYTQLYDPYQIRDGRLDSLEELELVEGVDDDWMAAFSQELTVYGSCKVNLNFASPLQIALAIRHAVSERDRYKTEGENFLIMTIPLANFIASSREFTLFKKLEDFDKMAEKPDQYINPMMLLGTGGFGAKDTNLARIPDGIEVRVKENRTCKGTDDCWGGLREVATVEPERTYKVEVITTVGAVTRRAVAVWDVEMPRSNSLGTGAWLYYRED